MKILVLSVFFSSFIAGANEIVSFSLSNNSLSEQAKKEQISRVISTYDLEKWWFTQSIIIDENARSPFSHPILTLGVSRPNADLSALSQLIHEQIHWFEDPRKVEVKNSVSVLKLLYPNVPVGYPEGARDELSTYLHIAVCLLELKF